MINKLKHKLLPKFFIDIGTFRTKYSVNGRFSNKPTKVLSKKLSDPYKVTTKYTYPIKNGSVYDYEALEYLVSDIKLSNLAKLSKIKGLFGYSYLSIYKSTNNEVEITALKDALSQSDGNVMLIHEAIAYLYGTTNVDLDKHNAYFVCVLGHSISQFVVIVDNRIKYEQSVEFGISYLDKQIKDLLLSKYNLNIGSDELSKIKASSKKMNINILGKDVLNKTPKTLKLNTLEFSALFQSYIEKITKYIKESLSNLNVEESADVAKNGILVAGGGTNIINEHANLKNLTKQLGISVNLYTDNYISVKGLVKINSNWELLDSLRLKDTLLI